MMTLKHPFTAGLGLCCSLVALALPAGTALADEAGIDEIVVTAQRRAQNLQDVPVAISAFRGDTLKDAGAVTVDQVGALIPNVQIQADKGGGAPTWVIRGVALFDYNANNNPATAIYIDDIYQSSSVMGGGTMYDLERVEVLKGPQGGLYGRNTTGGAVKILSRRPVLGASDGYFSADYGRWNEYRLEAAQSVPVSDNFALRVAATQEGGSGWQRTPAASGKYGAPDRTSGRIQALFQPNERLTGVLKLFANRDQSETTLASATAAYDANGNFCAPVLAGRVDNKNCLNFAQFNNIITGGKGALSTSLVSEDGKRVISSPGNKLDNHEWGGTLSLDYDFDSVKLSSITGVSRFGFQQLFDYDATNLRLVDQNDTATIRQVSQELRLTSTDDGPLKWLAGAIYSFNSYKGHRVADLRDNVAIVGLSFAPLGVRQENAFVNVRYRQETDYAALYGQVDYAVNDQLNLSASLRYSDEETRYRDGSFYFPQDNVFLLRNLNSTAKLKDHWSGKVSADYKFDKSVMAYAAIARGYKSGGVFGGFPQEPADVSPYKEEIVWSYEAGLKSTWLENRLMLNLTAFHYDHKDLQALTTLPSVLTPGQFIFRLTNVGKARHDGVELETVLKPFPGLTLQGSIGYMEAKVTDSDKQIFSFNSQPLNWKDRRIDFSPRWSGNIAASYDWELTSDLMAGISLDYNFRSNRIVMQNPVDAALRNLDGYGLLNGRISLSSNDAGWTTALWGRNLTNKSYLTDANNDGLGSYYRVYGRPFSYGISVSKKW
ncbi:TonB-dependent receptor [Niveispirillum sp. BGYR6]|uniref:TonB-dependent receptor n=1 Tax=Niveispirillum sp. BGYR6 TaxID=2971249 RepID=UPI0022B9CA92|nr:TonB-dependent receptor [Niveispirillum sp. BGYR6]MDG5494006.1 TonB-dependent receptor [Niveispirillum sp. BGYR6]